MFSPESVWEQSIMCKTKVAVNVLILMSVFAAMKNTSAERYVQTGCRYCNVSYKQPLQIKVKEHACMKGALEYQKGCGTKEW